MGLRLTFYFVLKFACKKSGFASQLLGLIVYVVHEFVDHGDGYLFHLRFGKGIQIHLIQTAETQNSKSPIPFILYIIKSLI